MKMHLVMAALAVSLLGGSSASAQVGGVGTSPLGAASPLAMGPGVPVAPTGIPLGATEMTTPGTSPAPSSTMGAIGCSGPGGPTSQAAAPLFDGGGMAGAASSGCAGTGAGGSSMPALPTLRAGRAGIPLGSTELGDAGLSPAPPVSTMFVSPIVPSVTALRRWVPRRGRPPRHRARSPERSPTAPQRDRQDLPPERRAFPGADPFSCMSKVANEPENHSSLRPCRRPCWRSRAPCTSRSLLPLKRRL